MRLRGLSWWVSTDGFNGWFQRMRVLFGSRYMSGGSTLGLMVSMQNLDLDL